MKFWNTSEATDFDILIVGSGATGLIAAAAAARDGSRVAVLEKSTHLGGTSAISGGTLWVAANKYMLARGLADDRSNALDYLRAITKGQTSDEVLQAVVDFGPEMIDFADTQCGLHFTSVDDYPDYRPDLPGSVSGGRSLDPHFYDLNELGELRAAVRPDKRLPFNMQEYEQWVAFTRFPWDELQERADRGIAAKGQAVVAPLVKACAEAGVTFVTNAPVDRLIVENERVVGAKVGQTTFTAPSGVVLASGGFEWNKKMVAETLAGPLLATCSPPNNTGDGIRMAAALGAQLGNMREAWWAPMTIIPGDEIEGQQVGTLLRFERQGPGSIIVDRHGRRFVNESQNYNDMTRAFFAYDPVAHDHRHLPAYIVFDHEYLVQYGFLTHRAGDPVPPWMWSGDNPEALAQTLGLPAGALGETIGRFNEFAHQGRDLDFTRGDNDYDRYWADGTRGYPNPSLAPLERGPYYAVQIVPGAFGTNGGIRTDATARALDTDGNAIDGLYAVGNTSAHPMSGGYPGAGGTLGPGMTMGYIAGRHAAARSHQHLNDATSVR